MSIINQIEARRRKWGDHDYSVTEEEWAAIKATVDAAARIVERMPWPGTGAYLLSLMHPELGTLHEALSKMEGRHEA
jgi:hypothetical protein